MPEKRFDVFLCHNSEDKASVIEIAEQLRQQGLNPWLDQWALPPGAIWQFEIEQQIESIGAVAVFVGQRGMGPWQREEVYAFLQEFLRRQCPVIPVLLPETQIQPKIPIFLRPRSWVDFRRSVPDPIEQLIWGVTGHNPNEGLMSKKLTNKTEETVLPDSDRSSIFREHPLEKEIEKTRPIREDVPNSGELLSERNIDYKHLRDLLRSRDWKLADYETYLQMLIVVGRKEGDALCAEEIENFPCTDIKTIDCLWRKYSRNHFGFSLQKGIYQEISEDQSQGCSGDLLRKAFFDRVGWRNLSGEYLYYSDITFSTSAPVGHLPFLCTQGRLGGSLKQKSSQRTVSKNSSSSGIEQIIMPILFSILFVLGNLFPTLGLLLVCLLIGILSFAIFSAFRQKDRRAISYSHSLKIFSLVTRVNDCGL